MEPQRWLEIREAEGFEESKRAVEPDARRFDEVFRGVEQAISTRPLEVSWEVDETDLRVISTAAYEDAPNMWVYFRRLESESCCELVRLELAESSEEEEG